MNYAVLQGKKILIISDDGINSEKARLMLAEIGCAAETVKCGGEAMFKLVHSPDSWNAVLLDAVMSDMGAVDLAVALQAIPTTRGLPLVLSDMQKIDEAKRQLFSGCVAKPYLEKDLLDAMTTALCRNNEKEISPDLIEANVSNAKNNILLVEDNEMNRRFFIKLLQVRGFSCDVAVDGEEAVQAFQKHKYDLIFMDCQMPVLDGYEATRRIRAMEEGKYRTPIVALTAYAMTGDEAKCKEAGMDEYLSKPLEIERVMALIRRYAGQA